ncbi:hypothetical protein F2Q69_00051317, partial [Brassica cretica]
LVLELYCLQMVCFWFIMQAFLSSKDSSLNFFIVVMHSVNAVSLLGETFLNSLLRLYA